VALSAPVTRDSTVTVGLAHPVFTPAVTGPHVDAAAVFRADLNHGFAAVTPAVRPAFAPVIVVPDNGRALGISLCPAPAMTICIVPVVDTLARLAVAADTFSTIAPRGGQPQIVATHHVASIPWTVYYAGDEQPQYAPMRERLRFEALALLGILLVVALGLYAYDRSANLRRVTERAQTEARFSAIVNTAMDAIIIVNPKYEIAALNRAAETLFGYGTAAALGRSVLELMPEAATDQLHKTFEHAMRTSREQAPVLRSERYANGRRRDGSTFPMDVSVSRTQVDGHPHLTIVARDVSEWKRAEETSEWQRGVLEAVATGVDLRDVLASIARFPETQCPGIDCAIHLIDDDGLTLRAACAPTMKQEFVDAMDEIVLGPRAATCGAAAYRREFIVTTDIATDLLWNDYRALAMEQGYRSSWALPIVSPQGRLLGALALYARDPRGPSDIERLVAESATQLAGIAVDQAHAAESLRQSEASFRSFVENSPIGIYRATGTSRLLAVNASLVELLGYESSLELLQVDMGRNVFVSVADRERLMHELETKGEVRSTDMEWARKDGTTVTVRVSARAYNDDRGVLWFSEGFVENVTPLRAAEQALRQSEKLAALGQLVSGVAHELNNPLAAVLHFAEQLLDDERTPEDLEALSVIRDQARRSRAIVRDLLSFVRFRDASRERVKLIDALTTSVRALQPVVAEIGAQLTADLPPSEVVGNTDRAGLQQIVTNLVINAAQASGPGGIVGLRAHVAANELTVVVEDSGPGIPPAVMDRIFEPFFTTKPVGEGTGLGLSVTLGIVQQMGGRITPENRAAQEGGGARFTVVLPVERAGTLELAESTSAASALGEGAKTARGPRVLIIDDEPSIRAALKRFFSRRGWHVEEAADGTDGLSALLAGKSDFAVVISDLKMPGCSGME
ncbi:MAG: PAS domain S-box protein, partial [Gemmatimonadaceae bacterium]